MVARQEQGQRHSESTHACEIVHVQNFLGVMQIKSNAQREREREILLLGVTLIHTVAKGRISSSPTANDKNLEKVLENVIICIKPIGKHKFSDTDVELTEVLYYCTYSENSLSLVKINGAN